MKHKMMKKLLATILTFAVAVTMIPTGDAGGLHQGDYISGTEFVYAATKLSNPKIKQDSLTYDCVWFGSYPQAEVVASKDDEYTVDASIRNGKDYIVDAKLYQKLKKATWKNNETTIGGVKYRRLKSGDATFVNQFSLVSDCYYQWKNTTYHYFMYQPIKWRILKVTNNEAFLLADLALDCKRYYENYEDTTWEQCALRSYLNNEFYKAAFSKEEQKLILKKKVVNADNLDFDTAGGNDTTDKIFLLSEAEVYTDAAKTYGFVSDSYSNDEARITKSTTYAKAMGCWSYTDNYYDYVGNCDWWLRSPGLYTYYAAYVSSSGNVCSNGYTVPYDNCVDGSGVRPALKLNLSSYNPSYAGTVSTNGKVTEVALKNTDNSTKVTKLTNKNTTVKLSDTSYVYNGKAKKPSIKVYDKNGKVIDKKYYSISYSDNIEVGKASITIKFKDKYSGTIKKTFTIKPIKVTADNIKVKLSKTVYTYNGKAKKPSVKVYDKAGKAIDKKYYTVSYTDNTEVGKATVTLKFKDRYAGNIKKTFIINPEETKFTKVAVKFTWEKKDKITGYQVQYAKNSKFTKGNKTVVVKNAKKNYVTIDNLPNGTYYYRVRTYKTVNGKNYYSDWSGSKAVAVK